MLDFNNVETLTTRLIGQTKLYGKLVLHMFPNQLVLKLYRRSGGDMLPIVFNITS